MNKTIILTVMLALVIVPYANADTTELKTLEGFETSGGEYSKLFIDFDNFTNSYITLPDKKTWEPMYIYFGDTAYTLYDDMSFSLFSQNEYTQIQSRGTPVGNDMYLVEIWLRIPDFDKPIKFEYITTSITNTYEESSEIDVIFQLQEYGELYEEYTIQAKVYNKSGFMTERNTVENTIITVSIYDGLELISIESDNTGRSGYIAVGTVLDNKHFDEGRCYDVVITAQYNDSIVIKNTTLYLPQIHNSNDEFSNIYGCE